MNIGGNQAVDPQGVSATNQRGNNTYQNSDGGFAARTIFPGEGAEWYDDPASDLYVPALNLSTLSNLRHY